MASNSRKSTSSDGMEKANDWQENLDQLRKRLEPLAGRSSELYHAMLISPMLKRDELDLPVSKLEPLLNEKPVPPLLEKLMPPGSAYFNRPTIVQEIALDTPSCGFHGHFFIAEDRTIFEQFTEALSGIYKWLKELRGAHLLSWINVPGSLSEKTRELIHWVSLVYHYGYEKESHHLYVNQHFWPDSTYFSTFLWSECPILSNHRKGWLTYQDEQSFDAKTRNILKDYSKQKIPPPEAIEMCLEQDLVRSSLSVIDVMLYQLPTERSRKKAAEKRSVEWGLQELRGISSYILMEAGTILITLQGLHGMGRKDDPTFRITGSPPKYWSQKKVADHIGKRGKNGKPFSPETISRRYDVIFGPTPKKKYKDLVDSGHDTLKLFFERRRGEIEKVLKERDDAKNLKIKKVKKASKKKKP
jgi:hypothetical protein